MTKELKEEIENYLVTGGYAEQLKDILICEDMEELESLQDQEDFVEPIEMEELY